MLLQHHCKGTVSRRANQNRPLYERPAELLPNLVRLDTGSSSGAQLGACDGFRLAQMEIRIFEREMPGPQQARGNSAMIVVIEQADRNDARDILALQKIAYRSEARIYNDFTIPPLHQTLDETFDDFERQLVLKASIDTRIVGSVRAHLEDGTCFIGKLIVHPDYQNRGIGARLMEEIEARFPQAERFELFTGTRSEKNLYLYRKLGYRAYKRRAISEKVTLVFLQKANQTQERAADAI